MSTTAMPEPQQQPLSEMSRVTNTFFAPRVTFTDINRSAKFWGPLIILVAISVFFAWSIDRNIGFEQVSQNMIAMGGAQAQEQLEKAPPEQRQQQLKMMSMGVKFTTYGYTVFILFFIALFAGLYLATFNFGMGANLKYKQVFAVSMYASLPVSLRFLLASIVLFMGPDPEGFVLQNPIATNPGWLINPAENPFLYGILSVVDLFGIWAIILTGIGISSLSKVKTGTAIAVVAAWQLVIVLVFSGLGAMRS